MGKNWGTLKYIVKAPLARPVNFFKYGGGFYAILEEYSVEEGVGIDVVREYLKIAFCEDIAWMAATSAAHSPRETCY